MQSKRLSWNSLKHPAIVRSFLPLGLAACSFACSSGESEAQSGPAFPENSRIESAIQARLTGAGFEFLSQNLKPLVQSFLADDSLSICVDGATGTLIGERISYSYCTQSTCSSGETGCPLAVSFKSFELSPIEPNIIRATVVLDMISASFDVTATSYLNCNIDIDSPSDGFPIQLDITLEPSPITGDLTFTIGDPVLDLSALSVSLQNNGGGASAICDILDTVFSVDSIRSMIVGALQSRVESLAMTAVTAYLKNSTCRSCTEDADCPVDGAACEDGVCMMLDECLPAILGVEGELDLGQLTASMPSLGLNTKLQYLVNPGSYSDVENGGLSLGVISGFTAPYNHCVPQRLQPEITVPERTLALRGSRTPANANYEVGVGITNDLIAQALWSAFNGGALCLNLSTELSSQLSTSILGLIVPGLSKLTRGTAPVLLQLSPQEVPTVEFGTNRFSTNASGAHSLEDPLLTLRIPDLWIDANVFIEGRWTRVFSLKALLELPVGFAFDGNNGLIPLVGNLATLLQDVVVDDDEIIPNGAQNLANLLPTVLGPLSGTISSMLAQTITLPSVMGFQLDLNDSQITSVDNGEVLAIFAKLAGEFDGSAIRTQASVKSIERPENAFSLEKSEGWKDTVVTIDVPADLNGEVLEHSYQVDNGGWRPFETGDTLKVTSPSLFWPGEHVIAVRSRLASDYRTLDPNPVELSIEIPMPVRANYRIPTEIAEAARRTPIERIAPELRPIVSSAHFEDAESDAAHIAAGSSASSCSSVNTQTGVGAILLFLLGIFGLLVRRSRSVFAILIALFAGFGCDDDESKTNSTPEPVEPDAALPTPTCKETGCPSNELCRDNGECTPITCSDDLSICATGDCNGNWQCVDNSCICKPFCEKSCSSKQYCCHQTGSCESIPTLDCSGLTCDVGFKPTLVSAGEVSEESCSLEGALCDCVPLDPLDLGKLGRFSAMVTYADEAFFSGYSETYGDLVVGRGTPGELSWMFVDGVPAGNVVGALNGPRGGVKEAGENVGKTTDIAVGGSGDLHVVYYDVTNDALKYARGERDLSSEFTWQTMTLVTGGQPGELFSAISIGNQGPIIAYRSENDHGSRTLTLLQANSFKPESAEDWTATVLASRVSENVTIGIPDGPGLYVDLIPSPSAAPVVVWYDRHGSEGSLHMLDVATNEETIVAGAGAEVLADEPDEVTSSTNAGADVSVAIDEASEIHICYRDIETNSLRYRNLSSHKEIVIDDGLRINEGDREYAVHQVGNDAHLLISDGNVFVVYQDSTGHDVYLAQLSGDSFSRKALLGREANYAGAYGFYLDASVVASTLWISNYVYHSNEMPASEGLEIATFPLY